MAPNTPGQYNLSIDTAEHPSPPSRRNPPQRPTLSPPEDYDEIGYRVLHQLPIPGPSFTDERISGVEWQHSLGSSPSVEHFPSLARSHADSQHSSSTYRPPPSTTTTRPHPSSSTLRTGGRVQQNSLRRALQLGPAGDERRRRLDPRPPTPGEVTTPQQSLNSNPTTPGGAPPTAPTPNIGDQATDNTPQSEQTQTGHSSEF
jgi:hypothetical protein